MLLKQPLSSKILNYHNIISMLIGQKPFTYTCLSSINMSITFSMTEFAAFSISKCTNPYPFLFPSCIVHLYFTGQNVPKFNKRFMKIYTPNILMQILQESNKDHAQESISRLDFIQNWYIFGKRTSILP